MSKKRKPQKIAPVGEWDETMRQLVEATITLTRLAIGDKSTAKFLRMLADGLDGKKS